MAETTINASKGVSRTTRAAKPRAAAAKRGNGAAKDRPAAKEAPSKRRAAGQGAAKDPVKPSVRASKTTAGGSKTTAGAGKTAGGAKRRSPKAGPTPEQRHKMIAEQAYLRAESRGFQGGSAEEDWFAAEADVDRMIGGVDRASP